MCIAVMCVLQLLQLHMHVCISLSQNIEENNVPLSVPEKYQKLLIKTSIAHIISAFSTYSFQSNESIVCCNFLGVVRPISLLSSMDFEMMTDCLLFSDGCDFSLRYSIFMCDTIALPLNQILKIFTRNLQKHNGDQDLSLTWFEIFSYQPFIEKLAHILFGHYFTWTKMNK